MSAAFPPALSDQLARTGILAVVILEQPQHAVPLAKALLAGGITSIELTLRTPTALESVRRIRAEVPEITLGVGTILTPTQVAQAQQAGASFGVAPGMNPRVVAHAQQLCLPFAPGVCTPTDVEHALEAGCLVQKFFPCEPSGGLPYLRAIAAPFLHLGVRFIPLGGITSANANTYLQEPSVLAIGGSWLAPQALIARADWGGITALAAQATQLARIRHTEAP